MHLGFGARVAEKLMSSILTDLIISHGDILCHLRLFKLFLMGLHKANISLSLIVYFFYVCVCV
jgi:hypothetical protein